MSSQPINQPPKYIQLWQIFPWMSPFYTSIEKNFDVRSSYEFVLRQWWLPFASILLYLAMIIVVPRLTRNKPIRSDRTLAYWNLFLAIFSTIGAMRTVPHLLWFMSISTFKETVCTQPQYINGDGATGLWCLLFTLSKIIELLDTLFVCLKGRPPIFLHWYHHISVLSFTWSAYAARHPGLYFIAMNFTVHSIMYTYYYLMAINAKPKWLNPMYITFMQITQMIVGVAITVCGFIYMRDPECGVVPKVLYVQGIIYGSYLYLFLEFLIKRFFAKGASTSIGTSASKPTSKKGAVNGVNGHHHDLKAKAQ